LNWASALALSVTSILNSLGELMGNPDPEKSKRVTDAMLKMQKIIVADLQKPYDGQFGQFPS
jgi:hypothetical protein